ncbi:hypothetical protein [Ornithinimicrobium kibberense]|uniref:hypothetical protein n=1 Tax=Ornithinimicrobium kibberense TaxID=282060 RepID=UPI003619F78A
MPGTHLRTCVRTSQEVAPRCRVPTGRGPRGPGSRGPRAARQTRAAPTSGMWGPLGQGVQLGQAGRTWVGLAAHGTSSNLPVVPPASRSSWARRASASG